MTEYGWITAARQLSLPSFALTALLLAFVAVVKAWPQWRRVQNEGDASLRTDLMGRIGLLEARIAELERSIDRKDAEHNAEIQVLRHRLNNETASLDAFIMLAEANPDRVISMLPRIKEMRQRNKDNLALERGAMAGAKAAGNDDGR